jgi:hypothetical protein
MYLGLAVGPNVLFLQILRPNNPVDRLGPGSFVKEDNEILNRGLARKGSMATSIATKEDERPDAALAQDNSLSKTSPPHASVYRQSNGGRPN